MKAALLVHAIFYLVQLAAASRQLQCVSSTAHSVTVNWSAVPATDLYYVAIIRIVQGAERVAALNTVSANSSQVTLSGLNPETKYSLRLRSHPASAPSIVWGWRNSSGVPTQCTTTVQELSTNYAPQQHTTVRKPKSRFTLMYRVSEMTSEIDFLPNHDSADIEGQVAYLSAGAPDGLDVFGRQPVIEYCVEHLEREWTPYISCNGPEASPRNSPADPTCMCQV